MVRILIVGTSLVACAFVQASSDTWYVDDSLAIPGDGRTWETAFKKIQDGIDAASHGDTVIVAEGTYVEGIFFDGKNIVLRSTDPLDPRVVASTIIDGNKAGPVVTVPRDGSRPCVLSGFTIRNGSWEFGGGIRGGSGPRLSEARIENNIITGNLASGAGGGVYGCRGIIRNNVISANSAKYDGGGLSFCAGPIQNNIITGNSAMYGGGLSSCDGVIQDNEISGNSAERDGGGLWGCYDPILSSTIVGNSAGGAGGGLYGCRGTIRDCIIWGNTAAQSGQQIEDCTTPSFSCVESWPGGGRGNIAEDPKFVSPEQRVYRLGETSPCIDAGAGFHWFLWPHRDRDGNCRLHGPRVDMGCYEFGATLDTDGDLLSDADETLAGTDANLDDTDGDGLRDGPELLRRTSPTDPTLPQVLQVPSDVPTIQKALCVARQGDEILVAPGVYEDNIQFCGQDVILRGFGPSNQGACVSTILDGGRAGPVVRFAGSESDFCVLSGFTIRNGASGSGGGIWGGRTRARIQNNVIINNSAEFGGGLALCDGIIRNNAIVDNSAMYDGGQYGYGGGLFVCRGQISNCIIWGNFAVTGAQLYECSATSYCWLGHWGIPKDPRFVAPGRGDYRLLPGSPCIDAGFNYPDLAGTDMAGMPRIMFGGKSLTVDIGAYEYYINELKPGTGAEETTLTWSSLSGKTYSIFYCDDMLNWHLADDSVFSAGDTTTSWTDDGSKTGIAPSLIPRRFYRILILQNP